MTQPTETELICKLLENVNLPLHKWFHQTLSWLPTPCFDDLAHILDCPPAGVNRYRVKYSSARILAKPCGPLGWSYYPICTVDGKNTRLTKMSCTNAHSPAAAYIHLLVELLDYSECDGKVTAKFSEYAILTVDSMSPQGRSGRRLSETGGWSTETEEPDEKRRKVTFTLESTE